MNSQARTSAPDQSPQDYAGRLGAGLASLESGRVAQAQEIFAVLVQYEPKRAAGWIGLALACHALGDTKQELQSIDAALACEPSNLWGLILKGDWLASQDQPSAASSFYLSAVRASPPPEHLPPPLRTAMSRAQSFLDAQGTRIELALRNAFNAAENLPDRFHHSMDVLLGQRQIYHSNPRYFHYPGLPSIEFHDREKFPWLSQLESKTQIIKQELQALLAQDTGFRPYIESNVQSPDKSQDGLLNNADWSACFLIRSGVVQEDIAHRCPETMRAIQAAPLCDLPGRSPSVLFSLLRPSAHIPPHCGLINTRLIAHLPLIVPPGCEFRVGASKRMWEEGKAWLFDDSIEHEAWNHSNETRVILLFEVWRPELSDAERSALRTLFATLDAQRAGPESWDI